MRRRYLQLVAVVSVKAAELVGISGLHHPLPAIHLIGIDARNGRGGV